MAISLVAAPPASRRTRVAATAAVAAAAIFSGLMLTAAFSHVSPMTHHVAAAASPAFVSAVYTTPLVAAQH